MKKFNEILKDLRKENNFTQKQLATIINVSDDCIYSWEKGKSEPSIADIIELANCFNVSTDFLLGRTEI